MAHQKIDGRPDWIKQLMLSDAKRRPQSPFENENFPKAVAETTLEAFVQSSEFPGDRLRSTASESE